MLNYIQDCEKMIYALRQNIGNAENSINRQQDCKLK